MPTEPLKPEGNGRNSHGQFAAGNRAGRGNPLNRRAQQIRGAMIRAVSASDIATIIKSLVSAAKAGDIAAAREVLDRVVGRAVPCDLSSRLDELEAFISQKEQNK